MLVGKNKCLFFIRPKKMFQMYIPFRQIWKQNSSPTTQYWYLILFFELFTLITNQIDFQNDIILCPYIHRKYINFSRSDKKTDIKSRTSQKACRICYFRVVVVAVPRIVSDIVCPIFSIFPYFTKWCTLCRKVWTRITYRHLQ